MILNGLHLLLTFQCTFECDHCFVWGSPNQVGTMTLEQIRSILYQGLDLGTVKSIYFEGGEPFMYYPVLVAGVQEASRLGFQTGIVTNSYWAISYEDAIEWLKPFSGVINDLTVSSDLFHYNQRISQQALNASKAAEKLGIPIGTITIAQPDAEAQSGSGQLPEGESGVMYRGRAAVKLALKAIARPWTDLIKCPYEDLRDPGRVHIDPLGNVHICQGIVLGNVFEDSLSEIWTSYNPDTHPIIGPLLSGGPVALVERYGLAHTDEYADECHLCYEARLDLRPSFLETLKPDQMYGLMNV